MIKYLALRATVMISTDVVNAKQAKRKTEKFNLETKHFGFIQQILDKGKMIHDDRYNNYSVFAEIEKDWFKAVVNVSAGGFMRIQNYHPISRPDMEKFIKRRKNKKG